MSRGKKILRVCSLRLIPGEGVARLGGMFGIGAAAAALFFLAAVPPVDNAEPGIAPPPSFLVKRSERKIVRAPILRLDRTPSKTALATSFAVRVLPGFVVRDKDPLPMIEAVPFSDIRLAEPDSPAGEAPVSPETFTTCRNPDRRVSFRDEMLAPGDFDTGRLKAMVVRDSARPERMEGFVRIPAVWGVRLAPPVSVRSAPAMLAEAVTRYTDIEARADAHLVLTDRGLFSTPFLYMTADEVFDLTPIERERFGAYLRSGGFSILDTAAPRFERDSGGTALKQALRDALGCHARFEPIPATHPIYHCFFEFDGPPLGDDLNFTMTTLVNNCGTSAENIRLKDPLIFLEGVFLEGRLVAVYSAKGYGTKWRNPADSAPQMKFGVNLVVYALTREGGMTARTMEGFSDAW